MSTRDRSFILSGELYAAAKVGSKLEYFFFGNCSNLRVEPQENRIAMRDYTQPGGGNRNVVNRVTDVNINMTVHDLIPEVLQIAVRGITKDNAVEEIEDQEVTVGNSSLIPLGKLSDPATIVVEKDGVAEAFVAGVDYDPGFGSITILEGGAIAKGNKLKVSYDTLPHTSVEALTSSGGRFAFMLKGRNEAQGGKAVNAYFHNASLGLSGLDLIGGDEFGEIQIEGELLSDASITAADESRFYKIEMAD